MAYVLKDDERSEIEVLTLPYKRNEKLLSILRRKTQKQYEIFVEALFSTNQSHVADVMTLDGLLLFVCPSFFVIRKHFCLMSHFLATALAST